MGRTRILSALQPPLDADYVSHFQRLADLNLEIRRKGPTAPRLLKKALLEAALGNLHASRQAAQEAAYLAPDSSEAWYQSGVACLLVAYAEAGSVECRPPSASQPPSLTSLMQDACEAFGNAARRNPRDEEAPRLLKEVMGLLQTAPNERTLRHLLRAERQRAARPDRPLRRQ